MARVRFVPNLQGFAAVRSHPTLVRSMENAANAAAAGTSFDVEVVTWPHQGRKTGPRTSVQIWAQGFRGRRIVNKDPSKLVEVLNRVNI